VPYLHIPPPPVHSAIVDRGFGAASCSYLNPVQIFQFATGAGFPWPTAISMTAIALRESGGCPTAHNPGPGEDSYGLWQINVQGNPGILGQLGLSDPTQLYDPATNARAAFLMWGGNDANLNTAWYINQPGYAQAYQAQLPVAQAAADSVAADPTLQASASSLPDLSTLFSGGGLDLTSISGGAIALAAGLVLAFLVFAEG
jgi:hypothetical protein